MQATDSGPLPATRLPGIKSQPADIGGNFLGFLPLRELFSLDLRSLAVLRIGLAFMLLVDWIDRLPELRAHYSDDGIIPRDAITGLNPISIHMFGGSVWFQALLAGLALVFALLLLVGYRTPFVTLLSWFLLISVHTRCPPALQGGDQLFRMLLFWSIFLPLGARYSIDSIDRPAGTGRFRDQVVSPAAVAYIVQICLVYWYASAWKWAPEWRSEGTAVYLTLKVDYFTTRFAEFMLGYPELLRYLSFSTLALETLGPVVLFFPFAPALQRLLVIGAFILFHIGLAISLELSNFPWVCCVAWLAFLPPAFWNRIYAQLRSPEAAGLILFHDSNRPRARRLLALLRTFLVLPESILTTTQQLPDRQANQITSEPAEQSWGVIDTHGTEHHGLDALVLLVRLSPVFGSLAGLLRFAPVRWLGERFARHLAGPIANARQDADKESAAPPAWAPPGGLVGNTLVVFCLIYIVLWNVRSYGLGIHEWYSDPDLPLPDRTAWVFPQQAAQLGAVTGLEQGWGLFAPRPGKSIGWHLVVGFCKDGRDIDLLRDGMPIDIKHLERDKPEMLAATYRNGRWRKMLMNLAATGAYPYLAPGLAKYCYREWNATHTGDEQVVAVEVVYMKEETRPPGEEPPPAVPVVLWRYQPDGASP